MNQFRAIGRLRSAVVGLVLGLGTTTADPLAARGRVAPSGDQTKAASSPAYCPQSRAITAQSLRSLGRISCSRDPSRPVILLVHGLHQNQKTWTEPSDVGYAYDYARHPGEDRIGDTHDKPNTGVYKLGRSPWLTEATRSGGIVSTT
ncbi:MAG: hypothetical protein ACREJ4_13790, partial [Candidatus Methylomirabilaceae bacterium]